MAKTRQIIKDNVTQKQFIDWDEQYVQRRPIQLQLLDIEKVCIIIFSFLNLKKILH